MIDIHTIFLQEEDEGQSKRIMEGYVKKRYRCIFVRRDEIIWTLEKQ